MAWEREGLYLIRDTGPKRFFRIFCDRKTRDELAWKI